MDFKSHLKELEKHRCTENKCVLSVYLNTDRASADQQRGEWKIRLKNGLKRLQEYIALSSDENQLRSYKKLRQKVEKEIIGNQSRLSKGVAIFASEEEGNSLWSVHYLQLPIKSRFYWERRPKIDQLLDLTKAYPKSGIILPNLDEVKVIDAELGEIKEKKRFEFDPETEEWTAKEGLASSARVASSASHIDDVKQRYAENHHRFYKEVATIIEKMRNKRKWEKLYLVGDTEMVRALQEKMDIHINKIVHKNLNNRDESKVLNEIYG
ncbi:VLRF1 family aeRF1-type release factor [Evansella cellulosilytica]|uniref:Protein required for attachment to host cells n=1 Tax=Evansella cellulosilytica (strain ATCC 21833 / DSM 2522 / FERM P-1141 / JCM 9156 / N-4) TaxID=649639 RepID=E6U0M6_EVAC2|nr:VLRF1 family aeRF1-type release factor [Evansella cellulosilytica]ADU29074.1 hypothetical protein Bcell_0793 [Evansella cellulosilytica DSM 2522]